MKLCLRHCLRVLSNFVTFSINDSARVYVLLYCIAVLDIKQITEKACEKTKLAEPPYFDAAPDNLDQVVQKLLKSTF
jgi:hypothetical protein